MKNINKKTGILLGIAAAISLAFAVARVAGMIKVKSKKHDIFCELEEKDIETEDDTCFEEEEYLKEEIISLWEHLEALSNMGEENIIEKDSIEKDSIEKDRR